MGNTEGWTCRRQAVRQPQASVHEEGAGELHIVEGGGELAAFAVHVGLHVGDAVVGLLPCQVLGERGGVRNGPG